MLQRLHGLLRLDSQPEGRLSGSAEDMSFTGYNETVTALANMQAQVTTMMALKLKAVVMRSKGAYIMY